MSAGRERDIRVRVSRRNLEDRFTTYPNDLPRGKCEYGGLSPHARLLLMAGLSCRDNWDTTLKEIESWLPDLGRDRHEAVRRELRERGFMSMQKSNRDAGSADGGQVHWSIGFFMEPLPVEDRDTLQPKKGGQPRRRASSTTRTADKPKDATMPGLPGHGGHDKPRGRTMPGLPGHGEPGHGEPGPGEPGGTPIYKKDQEEKDHPPTPSVKVQLSAGFGGVVGASDATDRISVAVAEIGQVQPGWERKRPGSIAEVLAEAVATRRVDVDTAARLLMDIAKGTYGTTSTPRRLLSPGPWWDTVEPVRPDADVVTRPAARCDRHPSEPAHNCGLCIGEAKACRSCRSSGSRRCDHDDQQLASGMTTDAVLRLPVRSGVAPGSAAQCDQRAS